MDSRHDIFGGLESGFVFGREFIDVAVNGVFEGGVTISYYNSVFGNVNHIELDGLRHCCCCCCSR